MRSRDIEERLLDGEHSDSWLTLEEVYRWCATLMTEGMPGGTVLYTGEESSSRLRMLRCSRTETPGAVQQGAET